MIIPKHLPKFEKTTLIVVAGSRCVRYFRAHERTVEELNMSCVELITYLDNEGFFLHSGSGGVYGSGSVLEPKKEEELRRFIRMLTKEIRERFTENKGEYDEIILFAPTYIMPKAYKSLSVGVPMSVVHKIEGNFSNEHPIDLLGRIGKMKRSHHRKYISVTEEEEKIQGTFERTQSIMRNSSRRLKKFL
ncbi:MAG: hypothetical protein EOM19_05755 [Candidatus Moranbacteria bacterium]|nr:hypothetical protein [Candidatus Moranbacteria bacterium]